MMQHKKWIHPILIVAAMFLSGCTVNTTDDNTPRSNEPQGARGTPKTIVYECKNDFSFVARVEQDILWLFLPCKTLKLIRESSASGEKFSDSQTLFWAKGDAAILEFNHITYRNCILNRKKSIWEHAKLNGVDYRAVGNEPGWYLEIRNAETMLFVGDYGNSRYKFDTPEPLTDHKKGETTYRTTAHGKSLTVIIEARPCTDSMSGDAFETTVRVQFDQKQYQGCGRALH